MTNVSKIKYLYCQKVLPLVYDDSLSYYEAICKFQQKLNEVINALENISLEVLEQANAYTDEAIMKQQADIDRIVRELEAYVEQTKIEFDGKIDDLQTQYTRFQNNVNATLTIFNNKIDALADTLEAEIIGVNARTDLAIQQNNDYIFDIIQNNLPTELKVLNFFTGAKVSIQDMFNYLCLLHVDDGATLNYIQSQSKTVNQVVAFNAQCTDIVLHGRTIFA